MDFKRILITEDLHERLIALRDRKNKEANFHKYSMTELACDAVSEYLDKQEKIKK